MKRKLKRKINKKLKGLGDPPILWKASARRLGLLEEYKSWRFHYKTKPFRLHFKTPRELSKEEEQKLFSLYEAIIIRNFGSSPKKKPEINKFIS